MKKFLAILLTFAMLMSMGVTAFAAEIDGKTEGEVYASYTPTYAISFGTLEHGTVTASVDGSTVDSAAEGATVVLTVTPDEGYALDSLTVTYTDGDTTVTVSDNQFQMPAAAVTVTATFKQAETTYTVTIPDSLENGSVTASVNGSTVDSATAGTTITLTVTPDSGYELVELTITTETGTVSCTNNNDGTYSFEMPEGNVTIGATFKEITYSINIGTFTGGSVTAYVDGSDVTSAAKDVTVTLTVTTDDKYQLKSITVTDASGSTVSFEDTSTTEGTYAFIMPASNVTVTAVFEEIKTTSASIIWGSLVYTYTDGSGWANDGTDGAGTVTVKNTGDNSFTAAAKYTAETDYSEIAGKFDVESATLTSGGSQVFTLTLENKPNQALNNKKIGTVTITITEATSSALVYSDYESADAFTTALTELLSSGETTISITLPAEAGTTEFNAITAALAATVDSSLDSYELSQLTGTIDLTISGAETVPENSFYMDQYVNDNYRAGAVLRSVTFTDALTISENAFFCCNMTSFSAPKAIEFGDYSMSYCPQLTDVYLPSVQTLGNYAFGECFALKTISLPECISIDNGAFTWCEALETVYAPKATTLGALVFKLCTSLTKVTLGSVESVNQYYDLPSGLFDDANDTTNIDLVLSSNQKVMTYDSSTKYWTVADDAEAFDFENTIEFIGYTFKSITAAE